MTAPGSRSRQQDATDATASWKRPPGQGAPRWSGVAGSVLVTVGSFGSGALPVYDPVARTPVLRVLREGAGPDVALGMVYGGLALLCLSWLYLGRAVRRGEPGTSTADLLRTAALWAAPLLAAAPLFSRDMYSYAAQAQLTHHGIDPYTNGPAAMPGPFLDEIQRMWVDTPAPYGPLWLRLVGAVAAVTGTHVLATVLCMRLLAVLGVVLIAHYLPRLAGRFGADPGVALWLAVLNPLLMAHFVAGGHNDALMLGLALAGAVLAAEASTEARLALAVAVATLGVLVKAPAALVVAFLVPLWARHLRGRHASARATAKVAAVSLATFAGVTLVTGLGIGWVHQLSEPGRVVNWLSLPTGVGMLILKIRGVDGLPAYDDGLISGLRIAGQVVGAVTVLVLWARSTRACPVRSLALALAVALVLGPVVQPWYLLPVLTFAAAVPLSERVQNAAAALSLFLVLLVTPMGATLFVERRPVLATCAAALVATWFVLRRDPEPVPVRARE